ncbi:NTP transferase domain-containing protein [Frigoribacterium sp. CFBP 8759]|uniref:molybdenum cofactor guanylyltransferase n=1 Tax=Frigoribacterium sp. CFBP 8759 TaxID=2775283 RepID=UPI00177F3E04|nr:NTP transferase domain-containing protein [Frigoribacterium sp. CFBP 8759]MBD8484341.1 NTP transferase domain-containing protein [Frigoribacterium sp. CFBP 8759]
MTGDAGFDAVLLAGGRASRVHGADKTGFTSGDATLLDRAVQAAAGARTLVVVGLRDGRVPPAGALLTREEPAWSGPVAALAAGLAVVGDPSPWALVLACDLPRAPEAVAALLAGCAEDDEHRDGRLAVDSDGRRQPLLALYRTDALRTRLGGLRADGPLEGLSLRRLLDGLDLLEVPVPDALCADVDTVADADRLGVVRREADATG